MTFGYNAAFERALVENTTTINAIAQTLVNRLIDKRKGDYVSTAAKDWAGMYRWLTVSRQINRPLVLIAHSLGGLVIKRVCPPRFYS